jgi:thiamine-monophosphate kinase
MRVSELGELGLIDLLAEMVHSAQDSRSVSWQKLMVGIGDDASAWQGNTSTQLATVDSFIQDVHFSLDIFPWEEVGWKALAVNLSDIAAMGGIPRYALVSLALPGDTEVEDVTTLYRGMLELAQQSGVAIAGGNISSALLVIVDITALGDTGIHDRHLLTRSAAIPGEQIAVTGYLGTAAAGLEMLAEQLQFDPETTRYLRSAFLHPHPRIAEGQLLVAQGIKTAIDISDGLISDLRHICKLSQVGAQIEIKQVPVHPAVQTSFGDKSLELALSGGEDYELLFTGSAETINRVKEKASCPITVIGKIIADKIGKVNLIDREGKRLDFGKAGWEHFTTR